MLKRAAPGARITAIDPDPHVLALARKKAEAAGIEIAWRQGFARDVAGLGGSYDKAVSSLVFHQVPLAGKREGVAAMFASIRPGGEVHIADYAHQSGALMRALFRLTVQAIDGLQTPSQTQTGRWRASFPTMMRPPSHLKPSCRPPPVRSASSRR